MLNRYRSSQFHESLWCCQTNNFNWQQKQQSMKFEICFRRTQNCHLENRKCVFRLSSPWFMDQISAGQRNVIKWWNWWKRSQKILGKILFCYLECWIWFNLYIAQFSEITNKFIKGRREYWDRSHNMHVGNQLSKNQKYLIWFRLRTFENCFQNISLIKFPNFSCSNGPQNK